MLNPTLADGPYFIGFEIRVDKSSRRGLQIRTQCSPDIQTNKEATPKALLLCWLLGCWSGFKSPDGAVMDLKRALDQM